MHKSKIKFFGSLNETDLCDNKEFCCVVKPLLSNKFVSNEKITLIEGDNILEIDKNTASVLTEFFSILTLLGISQYNEMEPVSHNRGDTLMKGFHPSIITIKENCNSGLSFSFSRVECYGLMKQNNNLKTNKATQSADIPTKLIKENSDFFGDLIFGNYNNCISYS